MNIIFMGTSEFAVPILEKIFGSKHKIRAVFTAQPKPQNRGKKLLYSPIYNLASTLGIEIHTPSTLKNASTIELINSIDSDLIFVASYGLIIPKEILSLKKFGCVNVHPSKLPKYRGATPIQHTIMNADQDTAVCIIKMDEGVDTGDIILEKNVNINGNRPTFEELRDKLSVIGAELAINVLDNIEHLQTYKQNEHEVVYVRKFNKIDGRINWADSGSKIECSIRALNPWPGSYFYHDDRLIKLIKSEYIPIMHNYTPGQIINDNFDVACGEGILRILKIIPDSKKLMDGKSYLIGSNQKIVT